MECAAAVEIWKQSEKNMYLRYMDVIYDGDAKSVSSLNKNEPYGPRVIIIKHECDGHVQNELATRFVLPRKLSAMSIFSQRCH